MSIRMILPVALFTLPTVAVAGPWDRPDTHNLLDHDIDSGYTFVCHNDSISTEGGGVSFETYVTHASGGVTYGCPDIVDPGSTTLSQHIEQEMDDDIVTYYYLEADAGAELYAPGLYVAGFPNGGDCTIEATVTVLNVNTGATETYDVEGETCDESVSLTPGFRNHKYQFVSAEVYAFEAGIDSSWDGTNPPMADLEPNYNQIDLGFVFDECGLQADINGDDSVTILDFSILASNFGVCWTDPGVTSIGLEDGDVNGDGCVTLLDFSRLSAEFGQTCNPSAITGSKTKH